MTITKDFKIDNDKAYIVISAFPSSQSINRFKYWLHYFSCTLVIEILETCRELGFLITQTFNTMKNTVIPTSFLVHDRDLHLAFVSTLHSILATTRIVSRTRLTHWTENNRFCKYNSSLGQVLRNYVCKIPSSSFPVRVRLTWLYQHSPIKTVSD